MYKILLVEDEENIALFVKMELEYEGYKVEVCDDGIKGLEFSIENEYDLILLDLMLPKLNGLEVCRRLRKVKNTPIIMLTARDDVMDKVTGFQTGADDYVSKPFAIEELLARIEALLRRVNVNKVVANKLEFNDISIDMDARIVMQDNEEINLTTKEVLYKNDEERMYKHYLNAFKDFETNNNNKNITNKIFILFTPHFQLLP